MNKIFSFSFIPFLFFGCLLCSRLDARFYLVDTLDALVWSEVEDDQVPYQIEIYLNSENPQIYVVHFPSSEGYPAQVYGFYFTKMQELFEYTKKFHDWYNRALEKEIILDKELGKFSPVFGFYMISGEGLIHVKPEIVFHFFSQSQKEHQFLIELKPLSDNRFPTVATPRRAIYFNYIDAQKFATIFTSRYWVERIKDLAFQIEIENGFN